MDLDLACQLLPLFLSFNAVLVLNESELLDEGLINSHITPGHFMTKSLIAECFYPFFLWKLRHKYKFQYHEAAPTTTTNYL
jgi:hypothetical protein